MNDNERKIYNFLLKFYRDNLYEFGRKRLFKLDNTKANQELIKALIKWEFQFEDDCDKAQSRMEKDMLKTRYNKIEVDEMFLWDYLTDRKTIDDANNA